jgi:hypothetical protein
MWNAELEIDKHFSWFQPTIQSLPARKSIFISHAWPTFVLLPSLTTSLKPPSQTSNFFEICRNQRPGPRPHLLRPLSTSAPPFRALTQFLPVKHPQPVLMQYPSVPLLQAPCQTARLSLNPPTRQNVKPRPSTTKGLQQHSPPTTTQPVSTQWRRIFKNIKPPSLATNPPSSLFMKDSIRWRIKQSEPWRCAKPPPKAFSNYVKNPFNNYQEFSAMNPLPRSLPFERKPPFSKPISRISSLRLEN